MEESKASIQYFNRYTQKLETEAVYGEKFLKWAYNTKIGRLTTKSIFKHLFFSKFYGKRMIERFSKKKILPFIQNYNVNMDDFIWPDNGFSSFNDFFIRNLKPSARKFLSDPSKIASPADGRHLGFQNISKTQIFFVKDQSLNLEKLLNSSIEAKRYHNGSLILSRLCPIDYHRFHFPVSGFAHKPRLINGPLFSVNPLALSRNINILAQNKRMITPIDTLNFGRILMIEVGATCVGSIKQIFQPNSQVQQGQQKGYFEFGGSSTILLFEPNKVQLDKDLLELSTQSTELYVHVGDQLASLYDYSHSTEQREFELN